MALPVPSLVTRGPYGWQALTQATATCAQYTHREQHNSQACSVESNNPKVAAVTAKKTFGEWLEEAIKEKIVKEG